MPSADGSQPKDLVQSVLRALQILDIVSAADQPQRSQMIARSAGLNLATTTHLLNTLVHAGYLERDGRDYSVSPGKVFALYARVDAQIRPEGRARQILMRVAERTGESVFLSRWSGDDVVITALAEGRHAVRVGGLNVGLRGDVHARASGKALLAFAPQTQLDRFLSGKNELHRRTEHTISDPAHLRADLEATRRRGFAVDSQEWAIGVWGLAIPLYSGHEWPVTAVTITAPGDRFSMPQNYESYLEALQEAKELDGSPGKLGQG